MKNFTGETMEHLHVSHGNEAYASTNRGASYREQMAAYNSRRDSIHMFSAFVRWRAQQLDPTLDLAPDEDDRSLNATPRAPSLSYHVATRPHRQGVNLTTISAWLAEHSVDVVSAISRFFVEGRDGSAANRGRWAYDVNDVPVELAKIDIWHCFRLYYKSTFPDIDGEYLQRTVRTRPDPNGRPTVLEPVLIGGPDLAITRELLPRCCDLHCFVPATY